MEDVLTSIWEDDDIDALSDDAAFLYLWSFTNERCNMAGLYAVKERHILEGRLTPARREAALTELAEGRFLFYVEGWIWVRSRVAHLRTKGKMMGRGVVNAVKRVPEHHPLRAAFLTEYLGNSWVSEWLSQAELENPSNTHREPLKGLQGLGVKALGEEKRGNRKPKAQREDPDVLPDAYPAQLVPSVEAALPTLRRVARAKGSKPVDRLPLGRAIEAFPDRDHPMVAGELEHWALHGNGENRAIKDVISTFRNFLKNSDRVQRPVAETDYSKYDANVIRVAV